MKILRITLLLTIAACYSCDFDTAISNDYSKNLVFDGVHSFDLDSETSFEFYNIQYLRNGVEEFLLVLNPLINGVNIYNLKEKTVVNKLKVPTEGPNGLANIQGFTAVTLDSIFLFPKGHLNKFILVKKSGELVNKYSPKAITYRGILNHISSTLQPTIFFDNKLYFVQWPLFDTYNSKNISSGFPLEIEYSIETDSLISLPVTYPKTFHSNIWSLWDIIHSRTFNFNNSSFIYSFNSIDSIQSINFTGGSPTSFKASLNTNSNQSRSYSKKPNSMVELKNNLSVHRYSGILYDEFRDVYYRFALNPVTFNDKLHKNYKAYESMPMSIIILNNSFEKIGETPLEPNKYTIYSAFVGKNGLYLPQINVNNINLNEDQIHFSKYVLQNK
ncbi:MAG: DUF4221 family protein [Maribacter sp.]